MKGICLWVSNGAIILGARNAPATNVGNYVRVLAGLLHQRIQFFIIILIV